MSEDMIGKRFGMLTVIALYNEHHFGNTWLCLCDCGNEVKVNNSHLLGTQSKSRRPNKSCGCHQKKLGGLAEKYQRIYQLWRGILGRCYNTNYDNYERFGGKGITVCDEWKEDFNSFLDWSLQNGYDPELTLGRMDVTKPYEPNNCIWTDQFFKAQKKGIYKNNKTGKTGVSYSEDQGTYRSYIRRNNVRKDLGSFDNLEDAIEARIKAEEYFKKHNKLW